MDRHNNNSNDPINRPPGNVDNQGYNNVPPASEPAVTPDQPTTAFTPAAAGQPVQSAQPPFEPLYPDPAVQPGVPVQPVSNPAYYAQPTATYYAATPPP